MSLERYSPLIPPSVISIIFAQFSPTADMAARSPSLIWIRQILRKGGILLTPGLLHSHIRDRGALCARCRGSYPLSQLLIYEQSDT